MSGFIAKCASYVDMRGDAVNHQHICEPTHTKKLTTIFLSQRMLYDPKACADSCGGEGTPGPGTRTELVPSPIRMGGNESGTPWYALVVPRIYPH
jgi:hypothetical protein